MTQVAYELPTATGAFRAARVAFVHSLWHADIVTESYVGFTEEMARLGFRNEAIERFELPGVFEIPLHACWPAPADSPPSSPPGWWSTGASIATTSSRRPSCRL